MRKKGLALLLVLALVTSLCGMALAANDNMNETGLPIVKDKITLNVAVGRHGNDATESYDEKHFVIKAEEETNIHINWIELSGSAATERVPVMLAGDLPDVFIGLLGDSTLVQNTSLFLPLGDLIETYTPNVVAYYNAEIPDWQSYLTYPDGNIYGLMGGYAISYNNLVDGAQFINTEWLKRVGKEIPTTLDEFYDVLVAFRDEDANGNGDPNDEIPLDFCQTHYAAKITNYAWSWGLPFNSSAERKLDLDEHGRVIAMAALDSYREFLEFFHKLGKEGLLNLEGFSQTEEQYTANLDSMRVGTFHGWAPYTYVKGEEKQAEYASFAPVTVEGRTPRVGLNNRNQAARNNFVVTKQSAYALEALRWWDYLSSDVEMAMFVNRGEEGLIYKLGDDGLYYANTPTPEQLIEHGYEKYVTNIGTSTFAASLGTVNNHPLVKQAILPDYINEPNTSSAIRTIALMKSEPYWVEWSWPQAIVTAEAREELDFSTQGLGNFIESFAATSIMEGVTDESWANYLAQLDVYGYPALLDWYQRYFDGEL